MQRRTIAIAVSAAVLALGGVTTAVWMNGGESYDDTVKACQKALAAQYKADGKGKPTACNDVKDDDYDALVLNAAMGDLGWLDDDGQFDKNKMIENTP